MKLTDKDVQFLRRLKHLMGSKDLWVELKRNSPSCMVLRGTYGEKIHRTFRMTRQGVRWRSWRVFNDIYVSAFETILAIEKSFGTHLRDHAIRISKERYALRQEALERGFVSADVFQERSNGRPADDSPVPAGGADRTEHGP